ncbi:MAG: SDR family NAD(P)-dependent oxidoreductase [Proteobacteria bacterium]|nr:SDR family NAD(P)-dependent oxidoreductase [Pseudomonadota bacterium]
MADLVLITGAAKRVGKDLALHYARKGWHVVVHHYKSVEEAIELQSHAHGLGGKISLFQGDLKEKGGAEELFNRVVRDCGVPRLLINNASVFEKDEAVVTEASFAMHMTVNLFTAIHLTQLLHARAQGPCTSIALGDTTLPAGWKHFSSYAMSKVALIEWVKANASGFLPKLYLHGLMLGPTLRNARESERHFEALVAASRSHKPTSVEEIAAAVDQLVEKPCTEALIDLS